VISWGNLNNYKIIFIWQPFMKRVCTVPRDISSALWVKGMGVKELAEHYGGWVEDGMVEVELIM